MTKRRIFLYSVLVLFSVIIGIGAGYFIATFFDLPQIEKLEGYQPSVISRVYSEDGEVIAEFFRERREIVPLSRIPQHLQNAFIAIEDHRFYQHPGIDVRRIFKAAWIDITTWSTAGGGASTITQQLARNLFLTLEQTISRKLKEIMLAIQIEKRYSKREIFEMYLNQIYFDRRVHGVGEAASFYFGKDVADITLAESALLAAIPKSPARYSPLYHPENAQRRKEVVLEKMSGLGFINQEEKQKAMEEVIQIVEGEEKQRIYTVNAAPYFVEWIRQKIEERYGYDRFWRGGLRIYTTLDLKLQEAAEEALTPYLKENDFQGALVAMDPHTGFIKALVGGRDFTESQFNRATQAYRQTGSAFKIFTYTAAIDGKKFSPVSPFFDAPIAFKSRRGLGKSGEVREKEGFWSPENYEKYYWGKVYVWQMFAHSINVASVRLLEKVGVGKVIDYAHRMGVQSRLNHDLTLTLGTSGMTLLELVRGYATVANYGVRTNPIFVHRIEDYEGNVLEERFPEGEIVLSPEASFVMIDLLKKTVEHGTGRLVRSLGFERPCGGKTGTVGWPGQENTDKTIDAWFVGFTPDLIAGVWIGKDDASPLGEKLTGSAAAIPVWTRFMEKALEDTPAKDFPSPPGVVFREIDLDTGLLSRPECNNTLWFPFLKGTAPQDYSNGQETDATMTEATLLPFHSAVMDEES